MEERGGLRVRGAVADPLVSATGRAPPRPKLTPAELREADALAVAHEAPYRDRPPEPGWEVRAAEEVAAVTASAERT